MSTTKKKYPHEIWHLINNSDPTRGGAQQIVRIISKAIPSRVIDCLEVFEKKTPSFINKRLWPLYVAKEAIKKRPGVIIIHSRCFLPLTILFKRLGVRTIFYCHAQYRTKNKIFKLFPCESYICVSKTSAEFLHSNGVPSHKTKVILNPYIGPNEVFASSPRTLENKINLASIGSLHPWKGFENAIKFIAHSTCFKDKGIYYRIIGAGPQQKFLESLSRKTPSNLTIELLGYKASPFEHLLDFPIVLIPSLEEGFGLVAIEAIYQGKIVIHSDIPALNEICAQDQFSFSFKKDSQESFLAALKKAVTAVPGMTESLANARREKIIEMYGLEAFEEKLSNIIQRNQTST